VLRKALWLLLLFACTRRAPDHAPPTNQPVSAALGGAPMAAGSAASAGAPELTDAGLAPPASREPLTYVQLARWLKEHDLHIAFSGYRCLPVQIGVPVSDGLLCTMPLHGNYESYSEEWNLWRSAQGRLSLVWRGRRNFDGWMDLAIEIDPSGHRFALSEVQPGLCDSVYGQRIEKAELDNGEESERLFAFCLQRGWYVWNGVRFVRDPKQPACPPNDPRRHWAPSCSEQTCALEQLEPDCLPTPRKRSPPPADSEVIATSAPMPLDDAELAGWLEVHNVGESFSDRRCIPVQVGVPASDGLLCTAPLQGPYQEDSEEFKLWRSAGGHLSLVWRGRRNVERSVELVIEINYSSDRFLLRETRAGACDELYEHVQGTKPTSNPHEMKTVRSFCMQRGHYIWDGKRFVREPRQKPCPPIKPGNWHPTLSPCAP